MQVLLRVVPWRATVEPVGAGFGAAGECRVGFELGAELGGELGVACHHRARHGFDDVVAAVFLLLEDGAEEAPGQEAIRRLGLQQRHRERSTALFERHPHVTRAESAHAAFGLRGQHAHRLTALVALGGRGVVGHAGEFDRIAPGACQPAHADAVQRHALDRLGPFLWHQVAARGHAYRQRRLGVAVQHDGRVPRRAAVARHA